MFNRPVGYTAEWSVLVHDCLDILFLLYVCIFCYTVIYISIIQEPSSEIFVFSKVKIWM